MENSSGAQGFHENKEFWLSRMAKGSNAGVVPTLFLSWETWNIGCS